MDGLLFEMAELNLSDLTAEGNEVVDYFLVVAKEHHVAILAHVNSVYLYDDFEEFAEEKLYIKSDYPFLS